MIERGGLTIRLIERGGLANALGGDVTIKAASIRVDIDTAVSSDVQSQTALNHVTELEVALDLLLAN